MASISGGQVRGGLLEGEGGRRRCWEAGSPGSFIPSSVPAGRALPSLYAAAPAQDFQLCFPSAGTVSGARESRWGRVLREPGGVGASRERKDYVPWVL